MEPSGRIILRDVLPVERAGRKRDENVQGRAIRQRGPFFDATLATVASYQRHRSRQREF
jgi:hypothetical protein